LVKISCSLQLADLEKSKTERDVAYFEYQTNKKLRARKAVGKLAYFKSEQELKKTKSNVKLSKARVDQCNTIAPYSGIVAKVYNKQYQYVRTGQELIEIFDDSKFELKMLVPSSWLSWLKKGYRFKAKLDETGEGFRAKISRISPKIDSVSKTVSVTAILTKSPKLKLYGMSGTAYFKNKR